MSSLRDMITRTAEPPGEDQMVLDVTYITERIISMCFVSEGNDLTYRYNLKDVTKMLRTKHQDNYYIINVSDKRGDLTKLNPHVKEYGWPEHLAPPLERLCSICKSMDSWLNSDPQHVVIIHCKGGKSRIANVIAAYMHYSSICASADGALDRFAMKRFYDDKLGGLPQPSQRRYVNYFAGLLSGAIKINSNALFLHHIVIHGVPNFDTRGGCRPFIKVYQGMQPIFTSGIYNVSDNMQKVCISISPGIPLRGDILIKCYHKKVRTGQREVMWGCQFHTCAISDYNLVFSKQELDDAFNDPRFPEVGKVEFVFGPRSDAFVSVTGFKSDVTVPVDEGDDQLVRSDSFENFNNLKLTDGQVDTNENGLHPSGKLRVSHQPVDHSKGPVDGSLYATVNKQKESSSTSSSRILSNGPTSHVVNGNSINSSMDSGFITQNHQSSQSYHQQSAKQYSTNTNGIISSSYTSNLQSGNYGSTLPKDTVKPLDETTQLDNLLEDLLNQQNYISSPSSPKNQDAKTITTTTRTFTTYTPTDSQKSPDRVAIQRAEVSYKLPGSRAEENRQLLISSSLDEVDKKPSGIPRNAFTYTPTSPRDQSKTYHTLERDMMKTESNKTHTLPYRTDYENKHNDSYYHTLDSSHFKSDSEATSSWLQQQQSKLQSKRDHGDFRSQQEKQLVSELKNAQNKFYTRRAQSESDELEFMDNYQSQNGPISPTSAPASYAPQPPRRAYSTDGFFPEAPGSYTTHTMTTESRSYGSKSTSNKPPPSPTQQQRFQPVAPPVRTSSKDYMRARSNSSSSWHPQANEPDPQIIPRLYSSSHSTPPRSPRALSPTGPHSTTTYTTYRTVASPEIPPQPKPQPPKVEKHYVTEVFVHRAGGEKSPNESFDSNRLDELERTLQKASESIMASKTQQTISETRHFENRYVKEQPAPKKISVIEEDRISLQPIGPGVQVLEPETGSIGTLNRPSTPGFPTSPAGGGGVGGGHIVSPTGTLQHSHHGGQQQYQTTSSSVQQQQYHQNFSNHDGLSVDTNHTGTLPCGPGSAGSPPSPSSGLNTLRHQLTTSHSMNSGALSPGPHSMTGQSSPSVYFGLSRRGSLSSLADMDMVHNTPKFVKDTSKFWYKPNITREEAIVLLKDKTPGTFVIRDSNSFPGAFGLALKVATLPPNVQIKPSGDPQADLVRHFLIEPTPKGVRLRGCSNEPVFGSLAALVYQHSMTPLALPCKLALPDPDAGSEVFSSESSRTMEMPSSASSLLHQGAACNVIYINTVDTESLTGPQAVSKAIKMTMDNPPNHKTTVVHFKVSNQGITLTDNQRKLFFRRHYPVTAVTYCGMDPDDRKWKKDVDMIGVVADARIFGFVARKQGGISDNSCHLFAELDPEQPASAIVNFVTKVMIGQSKPKS